MRGEPEVSKNYHVIKVLFHAFFHCRHSPFPMEARMHFWKDFKKLSIQCAKEKNLGSGCLTKSCLKKWVFHHA